MEDPLPALLISAVLVAVSAFFSFAGSILSLSRKPRLKLFFSGGKPPSGETPFQKAILKAAAKPGSFLFALRIWNLLVRLFAGMLFFFPVRMGAPSGTAAPGSAFSGFGPAGLVLFVLAFIVFSELIPAVAAPKNPERTLLYIFPALQLFRLPWKPLYALLSRLIRGGKDAGNPGDEEFRMALEEGEKSGAVESSERSMVEGVLYLGDRPVSAFMTHRSEMEFLDIALGAEAAREKALAFRDQGFFPVVMETQDNVAGVVSVQDILIALTEKEWKGLPSIMKPPVFIPETMSALKAFEAFRREDEYYLCVMDEYGGFAGSLRVRNLLEEIVGELSGSAPEEDAVIQQEDGSWLADGSVSVDELAKILELESMGENHGDYHTLAGFILKLAGDIPKTGDVFNWGVFRFKVIDRDGNRIDKVLISKAGPPRTRDGGE
ncbi:MAG: hemolysin family protein [Treponema sp.]|jgi:putative hemolysin|nr:hemolysin family protein [Treponema sp.]